MPMKVEVRFTVHISCLSDFRLRYFTMSSDETKPPVKSESGITSFVSGGVGGLCCVLVGHPFDLIKVRVQAGAAGVGDAGVFSLLRNVFAKEGVAGLYRGVSAPIAAVSPIFAVSFWGYDMGKRLVRMAAPESAQNEDLSLSEICVAGAISSLPTTMIMAPSERIKCLLQIQSSSAGKPKYDGMVHCAQELYKTGGIRSIYKGTFATLLRDLPGAVAYFGTYEWIKRTIIQYQQKSKVEGDQKEATLSPTAILTAGGLSGMATWAVSIPADVLKSRYQTAPEGTYKNLLDVYKVLIKEEGYGALFKGLRPALIRAFPANAAAFMGMEVSRKMLTPIFG